MDSNNLNNIDPKLRDTYERVMGTQVPASQVPPTPNPPSINGLPELSSTPITPQGDSQGTLAPPLGQENQSDNTFISATPSFTPAYTASDSAALQNADTLNRQSFSTEPISTMGQPAEETVPAGNSTLIRIIYVIGAIVFLVLYAFVWIKIFNVQLPF